MHQQRTVTGRQRQQSAAGRTTAGLLAVCATACLLVTACGGPTRQDSEAAVNIAAADPSLPQPAALSSLSTAALDAFLDFNAAIGTNSGYVAVFARDGRVVHAHTAGYADIEAGLPMQLSTRFRLASMTKPVTAVAAMMLVEEGRLSLNDPVSLYLPVAASLRVASDSSPGEPLATEPLQEPLTVRQLLTFSAGIGHEQDPSPLGRMWAERDIYAGAGSLELRVNRILTAPLYEQPGTRWRYGWTADVLARVVEVAAGQPFGEFLVERVFEPLGMSSTGFLPPVNEQADMARVYTKDEDGDLLLVEHPHHDPADWTPGGSGLVSTAGDYLKFALMLWNRGSYNGVRLLQPETVGLMTRAHVASGVLAEEDIEGLGWGLGMAVVVDPDATIMTDRKGDFWWSGYFGTTFIVSPTTGLVGVVLAQDQPGPYSGRPYPVYIAQSFAFFGL